MSDASKVLHAKEPFHYHEKTVEPRVNYDSDYKLQSSISPSDRVFVPLEATRNGSADLAQSANQEAATINHSDFQQSAITISSGASIKPNIDHEVDLPEPKNRLEVETKSLISNDAILETAHQISGYHSYYQQIKPTKSKEIDLTDDDMTKSDAPFLGTRSGEGERASSRARSLAEPVTFAKSAPNATHHPDSSPHFPRANPNDRKTNSDIQEIINGFVKLLNGNVQVQANTNGPPGPAGKPSFPSRTRINNRGPPRITDVPPIVFEQPQLPAAPPEVTPTTTLSPPSSGHTHEPPPYPFDVPMSLPPQPPSVYRPFVAGVPLPEQLVPTGNRTSNVTTGSITQEIVYKEFSKTDRPFNFTASSYIEKVNRTVAKVTQHPPVSPSPTLPLESAKNVSKVTEDRGESKLNKTNVIMQDSKDSRNSSSVIDIKSTPSSSLPSQSPVYSAVPPLSSPELTDNFLPSTGVGTAVAVLEPSTQEVSGLQEVHKATASTPSPSSSGIVSSTLRKRPGQQSKLFFFLN